MAEKRIYGIGQQWLPNLLEKKAVYVDKTAYVYKLAHHGGINYFLSRPRRFGKSLLVSTLQCYFEGRRELFRGMAVDSLETEWTQHPVRFAQDQRPVFAVGLNISKDRRSIESYKVVVCK